MLRGLTRLNKTKAPCRLEVTPVLLDGLPADLAGREVVVVVARHGGKGGASKAAVSPPQRLGDAGPSSALDCSLVLNNVTLYRGAGGAHQPKMYDVRLHEAKPGGGGAAPPPAADGALREATALPPGRPGALLATFKVRSSRDRFTRTTS